MWGKYGVHYYYSNMILILYEITLLFYSFIFSFFFFIFSNSPVTLQISKFILCVEASTICRIYLRGVDAWGTNMCSLRLSQHFDMCIIVGGTGGTGGLSGKWHCSNHYGVLLQCDGQRSKRNERIRPIPQFLGTEAKSGVWGVSCGFPDDHLLCTG